MKPKDQLGFSALESLLILIIIATISATGWFVWLSVQKTNKTNNQAVVDSQSNTKSDTYKNGIVTFRHASQFSDAKRKEILAKVADPLIYYEKTDLKSDLTEVVIDLGKGPDNKTFSAKYGYSLSEVHPSGSKFGQGIGYVLGENGKIDYWVPQLCDDGGCVQYPADFKQKYPANYQAYIDSQSAK